MLPHSLSGDRAARDRSPLGRAGSIVTERLVGAARCPSSEHVEQIGQPVEVPQYFIAHWPTSLVDSNGLTFGASNHGSCEIDCRFGDRGPRDHEHRPQRAFLNQFVNSSLESVDHLGRDL